MSKNAAKKKRDVLLLPKTNGIVLGHMCNGFIRDGKETRIMQVFVIYLEQELGGVRHCQ